MKNQAMEWFERGGGEIAIFDATNSTRARRKKLRERASRPGGCKVVFIESICDDEAVLEANMLVKVRASPDFRGMQEGAALADLKRRGAIDGWSALVTGDFFARDANIEAAARAGCVGLFSGVESFDQTQLAAYN